LGLLKNLPVPYRPLKFFKALKELSNPLRPLKTLEVLQGP
jgi:hypothetical protein